MKPRVCFVVSSDFTVKAFLVPHLKVLSERYDITLVTNTPDPRLLETLGVSGVTSPVAIRRRISPVYDLMALAGIMRILSTGEFAAVHSITPKAGLLAMLAGFLCRVPVRIHTFTGQVWVTRSGFMRLLLKTLDRVLAACATHVLTDSASQRAFLIDQGVLSREKAGVLGPGSISGVDIKRFRPNPDARKRIRSELGIADQAVVYLMVGRLNRDKGVIELAQAFSKASRNRMDMHLMLVGRDEGDVRQDMIRVGEAAASRMHFIGYTSQPQDYMAASDVFCLPSHREGFGTSVIEASAVGIPTIASRIYGLVDAVDDGTTGILHPVGDVNELAAAMIQMANDPRRRNEMGERARERAISVFPQNRITQEVARFYDSVLARSPATGNSAPHGSR